MPYTESRKREIAESWMPQNHSDKEILEFIDGSDLIAMDRFKEFFFDQILVGDSEMKESVKDFVNEIIDFSWIYATLWNKRIR